MPKYKRLTRNQPPTLLILAGIALLLIVVFAFKSGGDSSTSVASLEAQLDQALKDRRPDLAQEYGIIRAPALILLDAEGQVIWKQDEVVSNEAPLDLEQIKVQVEALGQNP